VQEPTQAAAILLDGTDEQKELLSFIATAQQLRLFETDASQYAQFGDQRWVELHGFLVAICRSRCH